MKINPVEAKKKRKWIKFFHPIKISLGYELTKREGKFGSPEKPLSDLGRISYISYWSWVLIEALRKSNMVIISELSKQSGIDPKDIIGFFLMLLFILFFS